MEVELQEVESITEKMIPQNPYYSPVPSHYPQAPVYYNPNCVEYIPTVPQSNDVRRQSKEIDVSCAFVSNMVFLVLGFFCPLLWCGGLFFLCNKNKHVQFLALLNSALAMFSIVLIILFVVVFLVLILAGWFYFTSEVPYRYY